MKNESEIPLFPLNIVLFPNSRIPLYIFEERYKLMINESIDTNKVFGINLFTDKKIYETGCSALVDKLVNTLENGEMNIVIKGIQRYKIQEYKLNLNGYYTGIIEYLEDENVKFDKVKMEQAVSIYNEFVHIVYKGKIKDIDLNDTKWYDGKKSQAFVMAEKSGLGLIERQSLLEIHSEDRRLDFILNYFNEVLPKLKEADNVSSIIKSNGYIPQ